MSTLSESLRSLHPRDPAHEIIHERLLRIHEAHYLVPVSYYESSKGSWRQILDLLNLRLTPDRQYLLPTDSTPRKVVEEFLSASHKDTDRYH